MAVIIAMPNEFMFLYNFEEPLLLQSSEHMSFLRRGVNHRR